MALVANTSTFGKNKSVHCSLSNFTPSADTTQTSVFGYGTEINCTDVEFLSITKPEKSENQSEEIQTNMRTIKDDVGTYAWEDWDGLEIFNDAESVNWKAFVAAQETDATGTVTLWTINSTGAKNYVGNWKAKISKAGGGGGDASAFDTGFTPTIRLLEAIALPTA